jgi:hypothetical protein
MKNTLLLLGVLILASLSGIAGTKELKQKKGFKVPEGSAFVTTIDINMDKVRDYIVQSPTEITIYNGKNNTKLYSIPLDSKSDESFLIDLNTGKFSRPDLVKDLNGNGVADIPIRGLSSTDGEYIRIVDPKTSEQLLKTRFAPNSDNLFIYDADGNDSLDIIIERLDSVLIFSSSVAIPSSVNSPTNSLFGSLLETYPNPSYNTSTIVWKRLGSTAGEPAVAVIVDIQGREVRRIVAKMSEENTKFEWDGKSDRDTQVPQGLYFVRVTSGEEVSDGKIVVTR